MDSQPHERVEISDYPGAASVPSLATPAAQRQIKQVDAETAPSTAQGRRNSRAQRIEHATPHLTFSSEDGRLVLTRRKWRSLFDRHYFSFFTFWMAFWFYGQMQNAAFDGSQTAEFPDIVNALLTRPSFGLVTGGLLFVLSLAITAFYVWRMIKFLRGPADYLTFDRAAGTFTASEYTQTSPALLRDITEVNVNWQGDEYQVSLKMANGGKIKVDSWYNEADALYTAGVIANYIGVSVTQMETPISISRRRIAAVTMIILLLIILFTAVWWGSLLNHVHLFGT